MLAKRRRKADRLLAKNIAAMYDMTTNSPVIRELQPGSTNETVPKDYAHELLKWHHLGPLASKNFRNEHANPRLERKTLFFTTGNRRYVMNVRGKPVPRVNTSGIQIVGNTKTNTKNKNPTNTKTNTNNVVINTDGKRGALTRTAATAAGAAGLATAAGVAGGLWYLRSKKKNKK